MNTQKSTAFTPVFVTVLLLMLVSLTAAKGEAASRPAPPRRPNIVLVMTDDQGYGDVGLHGNKIIRTPHLDRFAREGLRFTRFYCSPVCAPTRASLMTGRYYYRSGVIHTSRGGAKMHGDEVTLAERLAAAGYRTGIFGKWHLGDNAPMRPQDQGFHESLVHKSGGIGQSPDKPNSYFNPRLWHNGKPFQARGYCTDVFFDAALSFIERHQKEPFFVYLPTNAPHTPLEVSPKYSEPYRRQGMNETTAKVYGMVQNIDENFGRLLQKLDELHLRENTIVIFLTDNGPQQKRFNSGLRGQKSFTYEGGIRVPCFVQWPARWKKAGTIDRIAAHIDWAPTLLDLCGLTLPAKKAFCFDGVSLRPLLDGTAKNWPERLLFFQCHRSLQPTLYRNCAVVAQRFKLVGNPGTFARPTPAASRKSKRNSANSKRYTAAPVFELYDLSADPGEKRNVIQQHPHIAGRLKKAYEEWFADVRATRNFQPGIIDVGSRKENPVLLCRYQDATYSPDGIPLGWDIAVIRGGRYRLTFRRGPLKGAGSLRIRWQGKESRHPLSAETDTVELTLAKGRGRLVVQFHDANQRPVLLRDNSPAGDVTLQRLP